MFSPVSQRRRILDQVLTTSSVALLGGVNALIIGVALGPADFGTLAGVLAVNYLIARAWVGGILISIQKELSISKNVGTAVDRCLPIFIAASLAFALVTAVFVSFFSELASPLITGLMLASLVSNISALSLKQWVGYRASSVAPEAIFLLAAVSLFDKLTLQMVVTFYVVYYAIQIVISTFSVFRVRSRLVLSVQTDLTIRQLLMGSMVSLSSSARDRLVIAFCTFLFQAHAVGQLAYAMVILKGCISIGGAITSVRLVEAFGIKTTLIRSKMRLFSECFLLGSLAVAGLLSLSWIGSLGFGSVEIVLVSPENLVFFFIASFVNYALTVWTSNLILSDNARFILVQFFVFLIIFIPFNVLIYFNPKIDVFQYFFVSQFILLISITVAHFIRIHYINDCGVTYDK
jgi:hypothetical protein